jgi:HEAT repeat protein
MDELQAEADTLNKLGQLKPTPERLAQVKSALSSKWEGTQSIALRVLGRWGGRGAVGIIRDYLEAALAREHGWGIRGVAVQLLADLVGPQDVDWVLDLYFCRPTLLGKHELLPLVVRLPSEQAKPRLVKELASDDPLNRQAAVKAIGNMPFEGRSDLLKPLRSDRDKRVRDSAKALSGGGLLARWLS